MFTIEKVDEKQEEMGNFYPGEIYYSWSLDAAFLIADHDTQSVHLIIFTTVAN